MPFLDKMRMRIRFVFPSAFVVVVRRVGIAHLFAKWWAMPTLRGRRLLLLPPPRLAIPKLVGRGARNGRGPLDRVLDDLQHGRIVIRRESLVAGAEVEDSP